MNFLKIKKWMKQKGKDTTSGASIVINFNLE